MNMKKLLLVLLALTLVFAVAACATDGTTNPDADVQQEEEGTAEEGTVEEGTVEEGATEDETAGNAANGDGNDAVLTMATNATFLPFEYYEEGAIVGIDAEVAAAIAEKLGMELEIMDMEFGAIVAAVQSGKTDMGMAGMTVTEDRLENVNFSITYATGIQVIIVPEGSPITSIDDLFAEGAEYLVGVQQDTTGDVICTEDFGDDRVMRYNKGTDAVLALTTGRVDCVIIDNEPAKAFVAANEGLSILETEYAVEDYAICVAKENTELLEQIDTALTELIEDGTVQTIIDKYIVAE